MGETKLYGIRARKRLLDKIGMDAYKWRFEVKIIEPTRRTASMTNQIINTTVTTGEARLSYANLFVPRASNPGDELKYSVLVLIPKSDTATMQRIQQAVAAATQKGIAKGFWAAGFQPNVPIHDGDGLKPQSGEPYGPECKGHWVISVSSKQQQSVVDANLNPILNQSEVYSGIYGRVNINFYEYNNKRKGVGAGLGPVQKLRDGEPLGGGVSVEQAFGNAPLPPVPPQYQQQHTQGGGYAQPAPTAAPQYPPPAYPQQQGFGVPGQPFTGYGQAPQPPAQYQQPQYQQPPQQQIDPITGKPLQGGVWGI